MTQQTTKFRHIRDDSKWCYVSGKFVPDNLGGVTLAYIEGDNKVTFSAAICSPKDNFSKAAGREIAQSRLSKPNQSYTVTDEEFQKFAFGRGLIPDVVPDDLALLMELSTWYALVKAE